MIKHTTEVMISKDEIAKKVHELGQLIVTTTGNQGSGVFSSMSQSNCFVVLEQERGNITAGETVLIEPYSALMD